MGLAWCPSDTKAQRVKRTSDASQPTCTCPRGILRRPVEFNQFMEYIPALYTVALALHTNGTSPSREWTRDGGAAVSRAQGLLASPLPCASACAEASSLDQEMVAHPVVKATEAPPQVGLQRVPARGTPPCRPPVRCPHPLCGPIAVHGRMTLLGGRGRGVTALNKANVPRPFNLPSRQSETVRGFAISSAGARPLPCTARATRPLECVALRPDAAGDGGRVAAVQPCRAFGVSAPTRAPPADRTSADWRAVGAGVARCPLG